MELVEAFDSYSPPCDIRDDVERLLATVPPKLLVGLDVVRLTNRGALGSRRRRWSWSRGKKARFTQVAGLYHRRWRGQPACIELFVDQVFRDAPAWALKLRAIREGLLGRTLYHELGHHVHATTRPEHREREAVADDWSNRLWRRHARLRHPWLWALRPLFRAAAYPALRRRPRGPAS